MRKNPEFEELFDDDFEVTYEEYVPNEYRSSNDIYNDYDDDDDYYDDDYYDDDYEEDENLDDDCEMEKRKLYDEEDDDIIFFFSPEYGYAKDEEDCDEDNNL